MEAPREDAKRVPGSLKPLDRSLRHETTDRDSLGPGLIFTYGHLSRTKEDGLGHSSDIYPKKARIMVRRSTIKWVREGKANGRESGFIVTWDVNSTDRAVAHRLQRFVYGDTARANGREYRYPGFIEKRGVRYLGQSVIFVRPNLLGELVDFLSRTRIEHEVTAAAIG